MSHQVGLLSIALLVGSLVVTAAFAATLTDPTSFKETSPEKFRAKFETTRGDFMVEVTRSWSPNGADRFYNLVKSGYFDGNRFFRVLPGFIVQWGLHGDPEVNGIWRSASIPDDPVKHGNTPGTLVYAKSSRPNSRTTQLFINLADNSGSLDPQGFSAFGVVTKGLEVVKKLYAGYGEGAPRGRGPSQALIVQKGNAYLEGSFPELDYIKKATVLVKEAD